MAAMSYPETFYAAVRASRVPATSSGFSDETRLVLRALRAQAELGACEPRSTWGMPPEHRAVQETWANLGTMDAPEAMRLFVKLMDEERPEWWTALDGADPSESRDEEPFDPFAPLGRPSSSAPGEVGSGATAPTPGGPALAETRTRDERALAPPRRAVLPELPAALAGVDPGRWARLDASSEQSDAASGDRADSRAPAPRYQHAAAVLDGGERLLILGGSYRGRFTNDAHVLDLRAATWTKLRCEGVAPCAGHALATWRGETRADDEGARSRDSDVAGFFARNGFGAAGALINARGASTAGRGGGRTFLVGGRFKGEKAPAASDAPSAYLAVYEATFEGLRGGSSSSEGEPPESPAVVWRSVETSGPRPSARRDASVVVCGDALVVFGGEETSTRRFLDDAHALDLNTMTWRAIETPEGRPAPRAEHTACVYHPDSSDSDSSSVVGSAGPSLVVFGGTGANARCFGDLWVLDLATETWSRVDASGPAPVARAGHAGALVRGRYWCLVGGGNNENAAPDAATLDLATMRWRGGEEATDRSEANDRSARSASFAGAGDGRGGDESQRHRDGARGGGGGGVRRVQRRVQPRGAGVQVRERARSGRRRN